MAAQIRNEGLPSDAVTVESVEVRDVVASA
jgi:hypothetical protein